MRKKISSIICTLLLLCSVFTTAFIDVSASDSEEPIKVDGSYLTHQDSAYGSTNGGQSSRSITPFSSTDYLLNGECSITKAGSGKIYLYADTTAKLIKIDYLSVVLSLDYYDQATGNWVELGSWQEEDHDTYYVSASKMVTVTKGHYFRARAAHVLGMNSDYPYQLANTFTDGIYID